MTKVRAVSEIASSFGQAWQDVMFCVCWKGNTADRFLPLCVFCVIARILFPAPYISLETTKQQRQRRRHRRQQKYYA